MEPILTAASTRPLNVLVLPAWFPSRERPVDGIFVRDHVRAAALTDRPFVVVTRIEDGWSEQPRLEEAVEDGIRVVRVSIAPGSNRFVGAIRHLRALRAVLARERAEGHPVDVIHAHVHWAGFAAVMLGRVSRVPVVISEHSSEFARRSMTRPGLARAAFAYRLADRVCPVSAQLERDIRAYGLRARFVVVPNTVDTAVFHPSRPATHDARAKRLLCVGMLNEVKGHRHLLDAFARLAPDHPDLRLDLVGDGPLRDELEQQASSLGIASRLTLHGSLTKLAVADLMRRSDVLVLPSLSENMPLALVEALATGLPCVATDVGGVSEIVDGSSGVLVPSADAPALAEAISDVLSRLDDFDPERLARAAERRYGLEVVGTRWAALYRDVIAERARQGAPVRMLRAAISQSRDRAA
jgi:L-malate glycosyltransferase